MFLASKEWPGVTIEFATDSNWDCPHRAPRSQFVEASAFGIDVENHAVMDDEAIEQKEIVWRARPESQQ